MHGRVRVRVPLFGDDQSCPLSHKMAWIFTETGAFSLSSSLREIGMGEITVTPYNDDGTLRDKEFARWWDEKEPGAQAQDVH